MAKKFIGTLLAEMREAAEGHSVNTTQDTVRDITEVAFKQMLRKMRCEGYASPYRKNQVARDTANRILPEAEDKQSSKKCPPGYRFDRKELMCVPIKPNDSVGRNHGKQSSPSNSPGYNTWGNSGYNGGYAWEEQPTSSDMADSGGAEGMSEEKKKDACYHKVKSRYNVFPSAYASGALVQCRNKGAKNWGTTTKQVKEEEARREGNSYMANKVEDFMGEHFDSIAERHRNAASEGMMESVTRKQRIHAELNSDESKIAFWEGTETPNMNDLDNLYG